MSALALALMPFVKKELKRLGVPLDEQTMYRLASEMCLQPTLGPELARAWVKGKVLHLLPETAGSE